MIIHNKFIPDFTVTFIKDWHEKISLYNGGEIEKPSPERRLHWPYKNEVDYIPFGYGRARPINFNDQYIYGQYWMDDELQTFVQSSGMKKIKIKS